MFLFSFSFPAGIGRSAEADLLSGKQLAQIYTYSSSKGLFAGVSAELNGMTSRADVNEKFYGHKVEPRELLRPDSTIPHPPAAAPLYEAIEKYYKGARRFSESATPAASAAGGANGSNTSGAAQPEGVAASAAAAAYRLDLGAS